MHRVKPKQSHAWRVVTLAHRSLQRSFEDWCEQHAIGGDTDLYGLSALPYDPADVHELTRTLGLLRLAIGKRNVAAVASLANQALREADRLQLDMRYAQWDALRQSLAFLLRPHRRTDAHSTCLYLPRRVLRGHAVAIRAARQNPDKLYRMSPRAFEHFIAVLFQQNGFEVSLTPQTRDGGFDLVAENRVLGIPFKWLVECKRYAPGRNVPVQMVRSLLGVLVDQRASLALLITTSAFTSEARALASRNPALLHLWSVSELVDQLQVCSV